ncbi:hypothetical protein OIO90_005951 [Microbotryomycetes sp. JL221]|nr:hypothetical protein OIO90_005951 [Microbotryomycetes sp. JL221]
MPSQTTLLYKSLIFELVKDVAIEEHKLAWRRRNRINTARSMQIGSSNGLLAPPGLKQTTSSSRSSSPAPGHSPHKQGSNDGVALECLNCARMIGVARYASHLSGCMGFGGAGGRASRGDRRAAVGATTASGHRPPTNNVANVGPGSRASSYASDEESVKRNGANSKKRSGSANGRARPKKARTDKLSPLDGTTVVGSHPLAKTYSAPNATQMIYPAQPDQPSSAPMISRNSLPPAQSPSYLAHLASDRPDSDSSSDESTASSVAARIVGASNGLQPAQATSKVGQKAPRTVFNGQQRHPLAHGTAIIPDSGTDSDDSDSSASNG